MIHPGDLVKGSYYEVIYKGGNERGFNTYLVEATSRNQVKVHWINGAKSYLAGGIAHAKSIRLVTKEYVTLKGNVPSSNKGASLLLEQE